MQFIISVSKTEGLFHPVITNFIPQRSCCAEAAAPPPGLANNRAGNRTESAVAPPLQFESDTRTINVETCRPNKQYLK